MSSSRQPAEPDILLHACCGPCAVGVLPVFEEEGRSALPFFYNPNIHPAQEFLRRLEAFRTVCRHHQLDHVIVPEYGLEVFLDAVSKASEPRCAVCYRLRLYETARQASARGVRCFSSTLTISPYQDHELIRHVGCEAAREFDVEFLYRDLRSRLRAAHELCESLGLYRQRYCGCIFSEKERYAKALARAAQATRNPAAG